MINKYLLFFAVACVCLFACKKDAGEGGTSTIKGRVLAYEYDASFQLCADTVSVADEDVYIIYGADHSTYDNDYKTSYNGSYEFKYLQKGKYRLFVYSKDSTGAYNGTINGNQPKIPKMVDVEITSNGSTVQAPDLILLKNNH
jgi:hypothetical protein